MGFNDGALTEGSTPAAHAEEEDLYRTPDTFPDAQEGKPMFPGRGRGGRLDGARLDNSPRKSAGRLDGVPLKSRRKAPRLM